MARKNEIFARQNKATMTSKRESLLARAMVRRIRSNREGSLRKEGEENCVATQRDAAARTNGQCDNGYLHQW